MVKKLDKQPVQRKITKKIWVGDVPVGGGSPVSVQSMTNTETLDVSATVNQIKELEDAGADIVRVSVPGYDEANAFKEIKKAVSIPLVADIHFDYKIALEVADSVIGTYNNERIDFITNANRLNRVNTIYFLNEQLD